MKQQIMYVTAITLITLVLLLVSNIFVALSLYGFLAVLGINFMEVLENEN